MKPFDLNEALAHPDRIVHPNRGKAVQVLYSDKAGPSFQVVILWENGAVSTYTTDGKVFSGDISPCLFLTSELERVPFTVEGWKKGWEPIYRNGEKPLEVKVFENMTSGQPVVSLTENQVYHWHLSCGNIWSEKKNHPLDLFLIKPGD